MLETGTILISSFGYIGLLFAIAWWGRKRADIGRSIISNPYIYALSLAVYCTAWTFYGSVGRAVQTGLGFLPTYIGPTLSAALGWLVLHKIIRISKIHRITSIADFISSRYGKSATLGGAVTIIAVIGVLPYISLQLKAVSTSFLLIHSYPEIAGPIQFTDVPILWDTAFYVALLLAVFAILFGTQHLDTTERHEGVVAAIAFESLVKLIAFIAVGAFVTYGIYDGIQDIFQKASDHPDIRNLFTIGTNNLTYLDWSVQIFLSMMAVMFLPRQFQVAVVENVNEEHLNKAMWLFPLYLLAINIFVLPIAFGSMMHFADGQIEADSFVLTLPMAMKREGLTLFAFIGGMSAATGMVIVEAIALSTMICNDLVMPVLLRIPNTTLSQRADMSSFLMTVRRTSIMLVMLLGYAYFRYVGEFYSLVSIGLVAFAAVAQFTPSILGGLFWKTGNKTGALMGMIVGFMIWGYTLVFPSMAQVGLLPIELVENGPFGIRWLRPFHLFGLEGFDHISHSVFWSLLANLSLYIGVSLFTRQSALEHTQAALFVDVFRYSEESGKSSVWKGTASVPGLKSLLERYLGRERSDRALADYAKDHHVDWERDLTADAGMVNYAEKLLTGTIGSASARVLMASVVKEEPLGFDELMDILDETRQVIMYSRELEKATAELKAANESLQELDRLKNEFISTVTHELRTPLTSIRSLAEILHDNPDLETSQHQQFSAIIIKESERLTRLISQVLDFQKIESGTMEWHVAQVDLSEVISDAVAATDRLVQDKQIHLAVILPEQTPTVNGDRDRLMQVMVNLISNAVKFCDSNRGEIEITLATANNRLQVDVKDNGIGISPEDQSIIFEKFRQVKDTAKGRPSGTGLGLAIVKHIVEFHSGDISVNSEPGKGSLFRFSLPTLDPPEHHLDG